MKESGSTFPPVARPARSAGELPRAFERLLLAVGAALLLAGIVCIVAYNWVGLGRWGRFGLAQAVLLAVLVLAALLGPGSRYGKVMMIAAIVLVGPLLALFGQTYQTGADLSALFRSWAFLTLPWAVASCFAPAWLVWLVITETWLALHVEAFDLWWRIWFGVVPTWLLACALNAVVLVIWEAAAERFAWLRGDDLPAAVGRSGPWLIAVALLGLLTGIVCALVLGAEVPGGAGAPIAWILVLAAGYYAYRVRRVDLVMLALGWIALTAVALAIFLRLADGLDVPLALLVGAGILVASSVWGRQWLVELAPGRAGSGPGRGPGPESGPGSGSNPGPNPWFVKLLAGAGAWLAALFLYGATVAVAWPLLGSAPARAAAGLLVCAGCAVTMRRRTAPVGVFLAQLLLAASLAGFIFAFANPWDLLVVSEVALLAALLAAVLLVANPEPTHRLMMALALVGALVAAAADLQWLVPLGLLFAAAASLLWMTPSRWTAAGLEPIMAPLAAAVTAGLVVVPGLVANPLLRPGAGQAWPTWLLPAGFAVALAAALVSVVRSRPEPPPAPETPERATAPSWLPWATTAATIVVAAAARSTPGVLACLLAWVLAMAAGRGTLAILALVALAWYLVSLYYGLETSLLGKGLALMTTGAVLVVLHFGVRRLARGGVTAMAAMPAPGRAGTRLQRLLLLVGALLVFGSFNHAVLQKEALLRDGAVLRLALAPVDPRALMTGDYMALDYAVAASIARGLEGRDGFAILARDERGVGRLVRTQEAPEPRAAGELALRARSRGGRVRIGTDAWYFQEGHAGLYEHARFGEFRVGADGEALLVRLLGESLLPLGHGPFELR